MSCAALSQSLHLMNRVRGVSDACLNPVLPFGQTGASGPTWRTEGLHNSTPPPCPSQENGYSGRLQQQACERTHVPQSDMTRASRAPLVAINPADRMGDMVLPPMPIMKTVQKRHPGHVVSERKTITQPSSRGISEHELPLPLAATPNPVPSSEKERQVSYISAPGI